jgi:hypothetical protein
MKEASGNGVFSCPECGATIHLVGYSPIETDSRSTQPGWPPATNSGISPLPPIPPPARLSQPAEAVADSSRSSIDPSPLQRHPETVARAAIAPNWSSDELDEPTRVHHASELEEVMAKGEPRADEEDIDALLESPASERQAAERQAALVWRLPPPPPPPQAEHRVAVRSGIEHGGASEPLGINALASTAAYLNVPAVSARHVSDSASVVPNGELAAPAIASAERASAPGAPPPFERTSAPGYPVASAYLPPIERASGSGSSPRVERASAPGYPTAPAYPPPVERASGPGYSPRVERASAPGYPTAPAYPPPVERASASVLPAVHEYSAAEAPAPAYPPPLPEQSAGVPSPIVPPYPAISPIQVNRSQDVASPTATPSTATGMQSAQTITRDGLSDAPIIRDAKPETRRGLTRSYVGIGLGLATICSVFVARHSFRSAEPALHTDVAMVRPAASVPVAIEAPRAAHQLAESGAAAPSAATLASSHLTQSESKPPVNPLAVSRQPVSKRVDSKDTQPPQDAAKSPSAPAKPTTESAEDSAKEPFDAEAAASALEGAAGRASSCRQADDPSGVAVVTITFASSGRVTTATLAGPPFIGTATGSCIAAKMRTARIEPFSGSFVTVRKTVTIK